MKPSGTLAHALPRPPRSAVLFSALTILLIAPRVDLVALGSSSIRLEDLVLAGALGVVVTRWRTLRHLGYRSMGIGVLVAASLIAVLISVSAGRTEVLSSLLYGLRQLEYWSIFPVVLWALLVDVDFASKLVRFLKLLTVVQVVVALLQFAGLLTVGFSKFSFERGAGLTSGPYELGAMCAALACFWFVRANFSLMLVAILGVLLSSSRISILGLLLGLSVILGIQAARTRRDRETNRRRSLTLAGSSMLILAGITAVLPFISNDVITPVQDRIQTTSLSATWAYAGQYSSFVAPPSTSAEYALVAYGSLADDVDFDLLGTGGDSSNLVRFYRWRILLHATDSPAEVLFGQGPSFAGPSVDGAFLRIFIELGLIGVVAWIAVIRRLFGGATVWFAGSLVTVLVGSLFIDLLFAMRPMILFWVLAAMSQSEILNSPRTALVPSKEVGAS